MPLPPQQPAPIADTLEWGASGLAGVWAEKNTRAAIYAALRRKETFGTSGPRIQVRFFAGYEYPDSLGDTQDAIASAYAGGVPMGGELTARSDAAPKFFVWALRDPNEAWLQRAQIIKGVVGRRRRGSRTGLRCGLLRWTFARRQNPPLPGQWRDGQSR